MKTIRFFATLLMVAVCATFSSCNKEETFTEQEQNFPSDWAKWSTVPANPLPIETYYGTWEATHYWWSGDSHRIGIWDEVPATLYHQYTIDENNYCNNGKIWVEFAAASGIFFYPVDANTIVTIASGNQHSEIRPYYKYRRIQ